MLIQEQANEIISQILSIKTEEHDELLLAIADIIAKKLPAKYVEIYFVNAMRTLALRYAGSGEIGKIFSKRDRTCNLVVHNDFVSQVGPVIVLGEIRIVNWQVGEIVSYDLQTMPSILSQQPVVVANSPPRFGSPDLDSSQEIYLPVRAGDDVVGALVLYLDDPSLYTGKELLFLQKIADAISGFAEY